MTLVTRGARVGFTGSQYGLSLPQYRSLEQYLYGLAPMDEFHHGDCIKADEMAHDLARYAGAREIHAHPCEIEEKRAHCAADVVHPVKHHKVRNRDIARGGEDLLIACPRGPEASLPYSGTWQTVRLARRLRRKIVVIWPDGSVKPDEPPEPA